MRKRMIAIVLILAFTVGVFSSCSRNTNASDMTSTTEVSSAFDSTTTEAETTALEPSSSAQSNNEEKTTAIALDDAQRNSVSMLNYLTTIAQELNTSKNNNKIYLSEVYSSLKDNTSPDKIDEETQRQITNLLNVINDLIKNDTKRDRLNLLYNQDKANTIRKAIPNPLAILSVASSFDWKRLVISTLYTAVDSYNNYKSANAEIDKQYMISGWELDDEETDLINTNRVRAWNYMVNIVRDNKLPGSLALSEEAIEKFSTYSSKENVDQKLQFFESEEETYKTFGSYWLVLLDCYYEKGNYKKCLACLDKYNSLYTGIFRKDYSYAEILPKAIVAAQNTYDGEKYVSVIKKLTKDLVDNSKIDDWSLRYFAAQSYIDLYAKTKSAEYLKEAYNIAKNNVNNLVEKQIEINNTYINDVEEAKPENKSESKNLTEEERKELKKQNEEENKRVKEYNKYLAEKRKTELPSLYEPLIVNCELLFSLANELKIDKNEKDRIEGILQTKTNGVFISKPVNDKYSFSTHEDDCEIEISDEEIIIPVDCLIEGASITVTINGKPLSEELIITKVERDGKNINKFKAHYSSKEYKKLKWSMDAKVQVTISIGKNYDVINKEFKVVEFKENSIFPDKVVFKCTK